MAIQIDSVAATSAQLNQLRADMGLFRAPAGMGSPMVPHVYTGTLIDVAVDGSGNASNAVALLTAPADAVGVELWFNGNASDDYLFIATNSAVLNSAGADLAAKTAANLANQQYVASGESIVVPFVTQGTVPSSLRFAVGKSSGRVQGRWIAAASPAAPYLLATNIPFPLTGANGSQIIPTSNTTYFPAGYKACIFQISGTGVARMTTDGTVPSATVGRILPVGRYLIDEDRMGISIAATRLYLPTGLNVAGNALVYR